MFRWLTQTLVVVVSIVTCAAAAAAQDPPIAICIVADDPEYALTEKKPVQVGGGPMFGAARQRRYLDALRGPDGQPIRYKRTGAKTAPGSETLLDAYVVTYDGLETPVNLFLDFYHFTEPKAPRGFVCGQPINLGVPPADPFSAMPELVALAIEQGAERDIPAIPLDTEHPGRGVAYDHFRLVARAARAAAAQGKRLDPEPALRDFEKPRTILFAYPLTCEGKTVVPADIAVVTVQGVVVRRDEADARRETVATLLPGVEVPPLGLAAVYGFDWPRPGLTVKITYREAACPDGKTEVSLPIQFVPPKVIESPPAVLPSGTTLAVESVTLQVVIDHEGNVRRPVVIGGPDELTKAAIAAMPTWRAEPARVNGAPIAAAIVVQVSIKPATPE